MFHILPWLIILLLLKIRSIIRKVQKKAEVMKKLLTLLISFMLVSLFFGCGGADNSSEPTTLSSGVELKNMDTSVRPQDDFYSYVNGKWLKETQIPSDKSSYSAVTQVYDKTMHDLRQIIEDISKKTSDERSVDEEKIWKLYSSYMDTDTLEKLGTKPLETLMQKISSIKDYSSLTTVMAELFTCKAILPFKSYVSPDDMDSKNNIIYFKQYGLGLPNRDYYLNSDEKFSDIQKEYRHYISDLMSLSGFSDTEKTAEGIYDLEYKLAQIQWSSEDNRDVIKAYNKMSIDQFYTLLGGFDMQLFLKNADLANLSEVVVHQPSYFEEFGNIFEQIPLDTWKNYLSFHLIDSYAFLLSSDFVDAQFDFYMFKLNGVEQKRARDEKAVSFINYVLGELFGRIYVQRYFPAEAKERIEVLVDNLIKSYDSSIDSLTWMGESTKKSAREKLHKITVKIGYPDKWDVAEDLVIKADDLVGNFLRYKRYSYQKSIAEIAQPVDHTKWYMPPQEVNAYYDTTTNEIVFPAAILQPPFFNMSADMAVNYGGIGAIIGHEISHAFDDNGAKYDGDGNLNNWWSEDDAKKFEALGQRLVDQYSKYEPIEGYYINGNLTLGENMADLNGLNIAYKAYKISLEKDTSKVIDGFSGEERFFIGWAQIWRSKMREGALLERIIRDPHSPPKYRAIGVLSNVSEFYKTFDLQESDKMFKAEDERIKIW
jgi:endothelin-converting enzyme